MKSLLKRPRRRFVPSVQALEGRQLLDAALHAIGTDGTFNQTANLTQGNYSLASFQIASNGSVDLNGQKPDRLDSPTTVDQRVLNVSVGSKVNIFEDVLAHDPSTQTHYNEMDIAYYSGGSQQPEQFLGQQFIPCPDWANPNDYRLPISSDPDAMRSYASLVYPNLGKGLPNSSFTNIQFSIDGEDLISADPSQTKFDGTTGQYLSSPVLAQNSWSTGDTQATNYLNNMGSDLKYFSTNAERYDVGFFSFYVGPQTGLKTLHIDATYANGTVDHIVFKLNVQAPTATLTSNFVNQLQWGPILNSTADGTIVRSQVAWDNPDYLAAQTGGAVNHYTFGAETPGSAQGAEQFSAVATNSTKVPGYFVVVQVGNQSRGNSLFYNTQTGQDDLYSQASPVGVQNLDILPDSYPPSSLPGGAYAMNGMTPVYQAASSSSQVSVPISGTQKDLNGNPIDWLNDSPSVTTNPGAEGIQNLMVSVHHRTDYTTYLVFVPEHGIPIALLSKAWAIRVDESNQQAYADKTWLSTYATQANWQGSVETIVGNGGNVAQLLRWTGNLNTLNKNEVSSVHHADASNVAMGFAPGNNWTFNGYSGADPLGGGTYAGYLYGGSWSSSMSQTFTVLDPSTWTISFNASQYYGYSSPSYPALSVDLVVDGNVVGTYTPSGDPYNFTPEVSIPISLQEGIHTVTFQTHAPTSWDWGWLDQSRPYFYNYIDNVQVAQVS